MSGIFETLIPVISLKVVERLQQHYSENRADADDVRFLGVRPDENDEIWIALIGIGQKNFHRPSRFLHRKDCDVGRGGILYLSKTDILDLARLVEDQGDTDPDVLNFKEKLAEKLLNAAKSLAHTKEALDRAYEDQGVKNEDGSYLLHKKAIQEETRRRLAGLAARANEIRSLVF